MGLYFLSDNKNFEILEEPYFDELMALAKTENGVSSFLKERAEKRLQQVLEERLSVPKKFLRENEEALNDIEKNLSGKQKDKEICTAFSDYSGYLWDKCPDKSKQLLEKVFRDYGKNGSFNPADIEKVKNSFNLVQKVTKKNEINLFKSRLDALVKLSTDNKLSDKFKTDYKFRSFYDNQTSATSEKDASYINSLEADINVMQSDREATLQKRWALSDNLEKVEQNVRMEDKYMCALEAQYIDGAVVDVMRKRSGESIADFHIERLSGMNDHESVVFNFGVDKSGQAKLNTIFKEMGLSQGNAEDTNSWYQYASTDGKNDLWSPVMKVSEAKKVMPKLVEYMHDAGILNQLSVPMKAEEIFSEKKNAETLDQGELAQFMNAVYQKSFEKPMDKRSVFAEFPQEDYLFSGTQVSDDYFGLSKRAGRSGILYATTHCSYAASYDGVDGTATHDDYGSNSIGQFNGANVQLGFVNVYKQSKDDKFYENFGMEDAFSKNPIKGRSLSKEEALIETNETFVTPEKNPLQDKILHLKVDPDREFYVKLSEVKDMPFVQKMLDNRKSDAMKSFDDLGMQKRFQKQRSEFLRGVNDNSNTGNSAGLEAPVTDVSKDMEAPLRQEKPLSENVPPESVQNKTPISQLRGVSADYSVQDKAQAIDNPLAKNVGEEKDFSSKSKVPMKVKRLVLAARGLIQPKKKAVENSSKENVSQATNINLNRLGKRGYGD